MTFSEYIRDHVLVIDGATGTMIQALGLPDEVFGGPGYKMLSDLLNFSRPEAMKTIHRAFFDAGASAVETNTFGASAMRLSEYDFSGLDTSAFDAAPEDARLCDLTHGELAFRLSRKGAEIACQAREEYRASAGYDGRPLFVFGSLGPSNRVLTHTQADLVESTFDDIAANFRQQALGLMEGGADVLLFETQQDPLELKAAIFGAREAMRERGAELPIIAQVTVDQHSRMQIFNTDVHAALVMVQDLGLAAFGINCSIGPDLMEKTVEKLARFSSIPISVIPNAGLPMSVDGKTVYPFGPKPFGDYLARFVDIYGVNIVGGCCGTTPDHIRCVAEAVRGKRPQPRNPEPGLYVAGPQRAVLLDGTESLIRFGERLNVRGSKKVRDAVENESGIEVDVLEAVANEQIRELGCEVIDVCMDSNQVDTAHTLSEVVHLLCADFSGAMCLDSFQVDALAAAIKRYPGRPVINSISMEESAPGILKIDAVIEATGAHAPLYVGLCTSAAGPAATAAAKLDIATQIIECARDRHHVPPDRLFIDVNTFPIGSESDETMNFAMETLEGIALVKRAFPEVHTILGVGNLTNGLAKKPHMRTVLTSVFLEEARKRGLDAAIINPNHYVFVRDLDPRDADLGRRVIFERDMDAYAELEQIAEAKKGVETVRRTNYDDLPLETAIREKIKDGYKDRTPGTFSCQGHDYVYKDTIAIQVAQAMETHAPLDFINEHLMAAMQELGDGFGRGEVSLPHLLKSADVMRHAMAFLEAYMRNQAGADVHEGIAYKGTVVLGTVYQDVHSIGKDLAKTLLENYGYRVIDLGTMTPLQSFIDAAKEHRADAIGMSALLVQTSNHMIAVSRMMLEQNLDIPVLVGGAPVSPRHAAYVALHGQQDRAQMRDNVFYCRTAMDGVNVMGALLGAGRAAYCAENKQHLLERLERAEQRDEEERDLLRTLPRRVVPWQNVHLPPAPRFARRRYEFSIAEFAAKMDRKTLYSLNWRFGGPAAQHRAGHTHEELDALFAEWIEQADIHGWLRPQGVMGIYPCQALDGETVAIFDPGDPSRELCRLTFTVVLGAGKKDTVSGAQYFHPKESGIHGVIGLQLSTAGPQVDEAIAAFKAANDTEAALYLQGLSDRIAEDMANYLHHEQRRLLGLGAETGQRWSPGYPGMRDIEMNRVLLDVLDGERQLGVRITDAGEFLPTGTTGAAVSFHPEARYT